MVLDLEVLEEKLGWPRIVRFDAADLGGRDENIFGLFMRIKVLHLRSVQKIQFSARFTDKPREPLALQFPPDRTADQTAMASHVYPRVLRHRHGDSLYPTINNQHPTTNIQQPTSNNQHPTTNIQQPTSNNQHPTTNIQQPTSNIQHPTSNIQQSTSNNQHPTTNIQQPTSNNQHPTTNIQHPTSNIQHPTSNIQHPTSK